MKEIDVIYRDAGLDQPEIDLAESYAESDNDGCFMDTLAYEKLFEYFAFDTGEMPYGVAKARTGDPDDWILERLRSVQ